MKSVMVLFMLLTLLIKGEWRSLISLSVSKQPRLYVRPYKIVKQQCVSSDVVDFTTDVQTCLATNKVARYFLGGGKMCNFAIQLILQQCCKTSSTCFVVHFTKVIP